MVRELNENTGINISVKTLIAMGVGLASIISMWFVLQADIDEAKHLPIIEIPKPEITRMEFDMKDQMIRNTIMTTQDDVKEIKEDMKRIELKLDGLK